MNFISALAFIEGSRESERDIKRDWEIEIRRRFLSANQKKIISTEQTCYISIQTLNSDCIFSL